MHTHRLAVVSASLAKQFFMASATQQRRACAIACEAAVDASKLQGETVRDALRVLRSASASDAKLMEQLSVLSREADERALGMMEARDGASEDEDECIASFAQARAMCSLQFALQLDAESMAEAVYDAVIACSEDKALVEELSRVLREVSVD